MRVAHARERPAHSTGCANVFRLLGGAERARATTALCLQALVSTSVRGVLSGTATLAAVSFTQRDLPCVTLTSGHAFVWHEGMEAWMRVADWSWPASAYHSQQPRGGAHELADKMAAAQAQRPRSVLHDAARAVRAAERLGMMPISRVASGRRVGKSLQPILASIEFGGSACKCTQNRGGRLSSTLSVHAHEQLGRGRKAPCLCLHWLQ